MVYTKEQKQLLKKYSNYVKSNLGLKTYNRFRLLIYYFPQLIEKDRLDKLIYNFKIFPTDDYWFFIKLENYEKGIGVYNAFRTFIITLPSLFNTENYLDVQKFFKHFNI